MQFYRVPIALVCIGESVGICSAWYHNGAMTIVNRFYCPKCRITWPHLRVEICPNCGTRVSAASLQQARSIDSEFSRMIPLLLIIVLVASLAGGFWLTNILGLPHLWWLIVPVVVVVAFLSAFWFSFWVSDRLGK